MRKPPPSRVREIELSQNEIQQWAIDMKKSMWKKNNRHVWNFLCPLCKTERRVPFRRKPGGIHYFQVGLTAAIFTLAAYSWLSWKGIISFVPLWAVFETIYRLRMRIALKCSQCGFDPYLYLVDVKQARTEVERYWRKKFADLGKPYPEKGKPYPPPTPSKAAPVATAPAPSPAKSTEEPVLD